MIKVTFTNKCNPKHIECIKLMMTNLLGMQIRRTETELHGDTTFTCIATEEAVKTLQSMHKCDYVRVA